MDTGFDSFVKTLGQQFISIANVGLMKYINTGDRVLDSSFNILIGTIISYFIMQTIGLILTGYWYFHYKAFMQTLAYILFPTDSPDKIKLNDFPNNIDSKEAELLLQKKKASNINLFNYSLSLQIHNKEFLPYNKLNRWLTLHFNIHRAQQYSFLNQLRVHENKIDCDIKFDVTMEIKNYMAIWKDKNGQYVYIQSESGHYSINSDCSDSIEEVCSYIRDSTKDDKTDNTNVNNIFKQEGPNIILIGKVNSNKVFSNLHFTQKSEYLRILDKFKAGKMYPAHIGMENKLGVIVYGPPGTGKSCLITATANYLGRHILWVQLNKIKTQKELNEILQGKIYDRYVIVFEEIDCILDVIKDRASSVSASASAASLSPTPSTGETQQMSDSQLLFQNYLSIQISEQKEKALTEYKKMKEQENDKLNLGGLLTALDGLCDCSGRLIIATTNHPEKLDPALLRPGRLGLKLNLTNCTRQMAADILGMIFNEASSTIVIPNDFDEEVWSPAELIQLALIHESNEKTLEAMKSVDKSRPKDAF